jgi:DNA-binding transcriptional regulator YhcF (GntR family)
LDNLLSGLISSKTRVKILMRFFLNPQARSYLRELAKEFNVSTNAVREELNQLTRTQLLIAEKTGRSVFYSANPQHSLFPELRSMVQKVMGIDQVIDGIVQRIGNLEMAFLIDDYAEGKDTGIIDIVLVGAIDHYHLNDLSRKTEHYIKRKIRSLILSKKEFEEFHPNLKKRPHFLIWTASAS